MVGIFVYSLLFLAFFFWLVQVIDVLFRQPDHFESHTHKLMWFLVVFVGNIIGAVWYFVWRLQAAKAAAQDLAASK